MKRTVSTKVNGRMIAANIKTTDKKKESGITEKKIEKIEAFRARTMTEKGRKADHTNKSITLLKRNINKKVNIATKTIQEVLLTLNRKIEYKENRPIINLIDRNSMKIKGPMSIKK
jgi:hypothetical protein